MKDVIARAGNRPEGVSRTAEMILDVAERLVSSRGYNAVSYADIATEVGIRSASIHHHFPSKADLGRALVERYRTRFQHVLEDIDEEGRDEVSRLEAYLRVMREAIGDGERLCLCTMLAADYATLPSTVKEQVTQFADLNERWLTKVLHSGAVAGVIRSSADPGSDARSIYAQAQGAQLTARSFNDLARFDEAASRIVDSLRGPKPEFPVIN